MIRDLNFLLIGFLLRGEFFYIPHRPITVQVIKGIRAVTWPHQCRLSSSRFVFHIPGALCGKFEVNVLKSIEVLSGSCVTIPCSFDVEDRFHSALDGTCRALWKSDRKTVVFNSSDPQSSAIQGELKGDLRRKDCTTTLNNMKHEYSTEYQMRLECNQLKQNFEQKLHISVTGRFHFSQQLLSRPAVTLCCIYCILQIKLRCRVMITVY